MTPTWPATASWSSSFPATSTVCEFLHVSRADIEAADALAKISSSQQAIPPGVSLEHLRKSSIKPSPDSQSIFVPDDPAAPPPNPEDPGPVPGLLALAQGLPALARGLLIPAQGLPSPTQRLLSPTRGAAGSGSGAAVSNPAAVVSDPGVAAPDPTLVVVFTVVTAPSWAHPILAFLESGALPMDETKSRHVQCRSSAYNIINNELVKRSTTGVF
ncbi:uncharacterized protein [Aegilops tauschii subsp. strangulata]|uniref:uncharacterized protein n=1 Tax=Aegilops tauschii subsp. strangulata TaxID=200361 RepID=UPI00098ADC07|nr:uncharacterized protein LOC109732594 [Aegilops tauschii subsp. strangulata]